MKNLNIGLFGFGNVGRGLYDVLKRINSENVHIKRVCVRDINKSRGVDVEFTDNPHTNISKIFFSHPYRSCVL